MVKERFAIEILTVLGGGTADWERAIELIEEIEDSKDQENVFYEFAESIKEFIKNGFEVDPVFLALRSIAIVAEVHDYLNYYANYLDSHVMIEDEIGLYKKVYEKYMEEGEIKGALEVILRRLDINLYELQQMMRLIRSLESSTDMTAEEIIEDDFLIEIIKELSYDTTDTPETLKLLYEIYKEEDYGKPVVEGLLEPLRLSISNDTVMKMLDTMKELEKMSTEPQKVINSYWEPFRVLSEEYSDRSPEFIANKIKSYMENL